MDRRSPERSSAAIASHQPAQPRCREGARLRRLGRAGTRNRRMRRFEPGGSATPPRRLPMCWSECSWRLVSRIAAWPRGPSSSEAAVISTTPRGGLSPARVPSRLSASSCRAIPLCLFARSSPRRVPRILYVVYSFSAFRCRPATQGDKRDQRDRSDPSGAVEVFGRSASAVVCGPAL